MRNKKGSFDLLFLTIFKDKVAYKSHKSIPAHITDFPKRRAG
jgi:hypothetical protein